MGCGVGGAPKIPKILKILRKLGYQKVVAIFDGDKVEDKQKLEKDYPTYKFFNISTEDIRDKPEIINKAAKNGMMTIKGKLKDE